MNILQVHNFYQYFGGEDIVVERERAMLERQGNRVITYYKESKEIENYNFFQKLKMVLTMVYNPATIRELRKIFSENDIDVVHIHNYWPMISPSVIFFLNKRKVPYVQTIHNHRYIVANALLDKEDVIVNGKVLLKKRSLKSYRNSYTLTFIYSMISKMVIYSNVIRDGSGALIVLNKYSYDIMRIYFDSKKLFIKGHFLPDERIPPQVSMHKKEFYFLFIGRLADGKGLSSLIEAYKRSEILNPLYIVGTGPLETELKQLSEGNENIKFLGFKGGEEKNALLENASVLIIPSVWQELFGLVVMEAYFSGTPVIAARIGGLPIMVAEGKTGILFEPGNTDDLAEKLRYASDNQDKFLTMAAGVRDYAMQHFREEDNYKQLMEIYHSVINRVKAK